MHQCEVFAEAGTCGHVASQPDWEVIELQRQEDAKATVAGVRMIGQAYGRQVAAISDVFNALADGFRVEIDKSAFTLAGPGRGA